MRGDKKALALIFDAMAFLTILTIVSVTSGIQHRR
jgi:hypothetical protein